MGRRGRLTHGRLSEAEALSNAGRHDEGLEAHGRRFG